MLYLQRNGKKMENFFKILMSSPLFDEIGENELSSLLNCLAAKTVKYEKNDIILSSPEKLRSIRFVLTGSVYVVQDDFWGNRTIIAYIPAGNTFAEAFTCCEDEYLPLSAVAAEECEIMLIDYSRIIKNCPSSCSFHNTLIKNMIKIVASKNIMLTRKMEHLTKRTTREKILSFLSFRAAEAENTKFSIPFDRQGLADYLAVDRSALSRELSALQNEGIIKYRKNAFEIMSLNDKTIR